MRSQTPPDATSCRCSPNSSTVTAIRAGGTAADLTPGDRQASERVGLRGSRERDARGTRDAVPTHPGADGRGHRLAGDRRRTVGRAAGQAARDLDRGAELRAERFRRPCARCAMRRGRGTPPARRRARRAPYPQTSSRRLRARLSSTCTGLKWTSAWLSRPSRELPSELISTISGLATSCQPINAAIDAGFEVVSEAKPTATTHTHAGGQQRKAQPVEHERAAGRRKVRGEHDSCPPAAREARRTTAPADRKSGRHARREQRQTRATGHDEVAKDARRRIAGAGLDADQYRGQRAEEQREHAQAVAECARSASRLHIAAGLKNAGSP